MMETGRGDSILALFASWGLDYIFFSFLFLIFFPLLFAWDFWAKRLTKTLWERGAFLSFASLAVSGGVFGILGVFGVLSITTLLAASFLAGGVLYYAGKKLLRGVEPNSFSREGTLTEKVLTGVLAGFLFSRLLPVLFSPPFGTDSYMYHLYYPAAWIQEGVISRHSLIGLFPEYYPIFGELLFGVFMLPMSNSSCAGLLQLIALAAGCCSGVALGERLGFSRKYALTAVLLLAGTSIVQMNALMAYTDILNAAFCLGAFFFMVMAFQEDESFYFIFSGVLFGLSASIKPLGLLWSPVIAFVFLMTLWGIWKNSWKKILLFAGCAFITALLFYLRNWIDTGNPFYPQKVAIGPWVIFGNGVTAGAYSPIGLKNCWEFLTEGGLFGLGKRGAYFFAAVLICGGAVYLTALFLKRFREKWFCSKETFLLYSVFVPAIPLFLLFHASFYPRIAENRSFLLLFFFLIFFILPFLTMLESLPGKDKWALIFLPVLLLLVWTTGSETYFISLGLMLLAGGGSFFLFRKERKQEKWGRTLGLMLLLLLPLAFPFRAGSNRAYFSLFFSGEEALSIEKIRQYYRAGKACVINYVGGVFCYAYMEEMPENRVLYVPISKKDSSHIHDFASYKEMRESPVSYGEYLDRLRKRKVSFLIVNTDTPAIIYNRYQEVKWAQAHPERFRLLAGGGENATFFMYEILWD